MGGEEGAESSLNNNSKNQNAIQVGRQLGCKKS